MRMNVGLIVFVCTARATATTMAGIVATTTAPTTASAAMGSTHATRAPRHARMHGTPAAHARARAATAAPLCQPRRTRGGRACCCDAGVVSLHVGVTSSVSCAMAGATTSRTCA